MAKVIEGVITMLRSAGPYNYPGEAVHYILSYTIDGFIYKKKSPTKASFALCGDFVRICYKDVGRKWGQQRCIDSIEVIRPNFLIGPIKSEEVDGEKRLKALEIASRMLIASSDVKGLPLNDINELIVYQANRIIGYLRSDSPES